jgi:flagellar biosynthetic protein FliR
MGSFLEQTLIEVVLTFTLVLARVGGMITTAPLFSSTEIPMTVRGALAVSLTLLLMPLQWGTLEATPAITLQYIILLVGEALIGMVLGLGIVLLMGGIQIAGQIAGQLGGMSLADVFNPSFDTEMPLFSHLLSLVMMAILAIVGGHRLLIGGLIQTFRALPIGSDHVLDGAGPFMVTMLSESMSLGIRVAGPAMMALVLTNVLIGLVGRGMPALNVMSLGFGVNSLVCLGTLALSIGTMAWLFEERLPDTIERSTQIVVEPAQAATTKDPRG